MENFSILKFDTPEPDKKMIKRYLRDRGNSERIDALITECISLSRDSLPRLLGGVSGGNERRYCPIRRYYRYFRKSRKAS